MLESSGKTILLPGRKRGPALFLENVDVLTDDETLGAAILPQQSLKQKRRLEELVDLANLDPVVSSQNDIEIRLQPFPNQICPAQTLRPLKLPRIVRGRPGFSLARPIRRLAELINCLDQSDEPRKSIDC